MVTTLSTSCNCRSQMWLVFIFCYRYILSITILIQFFSFLKVCIHFFGTLCVCVYIYVCVCVYIYTENIYIYTHTHTHSFKFLVPSYIYIYRWWNQKLKGAGTNLMFSVSCSIFMTLSILEFWSNLHKLWKFENCSVTVVASAAAYVCVWVHSRMRERERESVPKMYFGEIWDFHGCNYEDSCILGCHAVWYTCTDVSRVEMCHTPWYVQKCVKQSDISTQMCQALWSKCTNVSQAHTASIIYPEGSMTPCNFGAHLSII